MRYLFTLLFLLSSFSFSFQTQGQIEEKNESLTVSELVQRELKKLEEDREFEEYLANIEKRDKTKQDQFTLNCETTKFSEINKTEDEEFKQLNSVTKHIMSVLREDNQILVTRISGEGKMGSPKKYLIFNESEMTNQMFAMSPSYGLWFEALVIDLAKMTATISVQGGDFTNVWLMECE